MNERNVTLQISLNDYISAGYFVTQFIETTSQNEWMRSVAGATEDLLPERFISVGFCGSPHAPIFDWVGPTDEDYMLFNIAQERIPELSQWANSLYDTEIGYPNVFFHLSTAREYVSRFISNANDLLLIGIALHKDQLAKIAEAERLFPTRKNDNGTTTSGYGDYGFTETLKLKETPSQGEILGFDVIGTHYNIEHSWHCNALAAIAFREFHFRPNQYGLIDDQANAILSANDANEHHVEDCLWLPFLVIRYPLQP